MSKLKNFGSICSGIEAASLVLEPLGVHAAWLSEIADFPSRFLSEKFPNVKNLGDMNLIPEMIANKEIAAPDLICGGTPCQAFSLAGWRNGINDNRGQLTLKYIDIINEIDNIRKKQKKSRTIFFWENVEGALSDKTNAFGCFLAGLLGLSEPIQVNKWTTAGVVYGKERNIAWRVLDAKYFGVPQQRRRVYVLGGGSDFHPECVLFEKGNKIADPYRQEVKSNQLNLFSAPEASPVHFPLQKVVNGCEIEAFRSYSDCLYSAYGTKWNGNAAAYNGSLYFSQDGRIRRLTPKECERLMGFPDDYTALPNCRITNRYQAVGNSWAVPVVRWIAKRLISEKYDDISLGSPSLCNEEFSLYLMEDFTRSCSNYYINTSKMPYDYKLANMVDIAETDVPETLYITPKGCAGILRRREERNVNMNERLKVILTNCSK